MAWEWWWLLEVVARKDLVLVLAAHDKHCWAVQVSSCGFFRLSSTPFVEVERREDAHILRDSMVEVVEGEFGRILLDLMAEVVEQENAHISRDSLAELVEAECTWKKCTLMACSFQECRKKEYSRMPGTLGEHTWKGCTARVDPSWISPVPPDSKKNIYA